MTPPNDIGLDGALVSRGSTDAAFAVDFIHRVRFTRDLFDPANPTLADALDPQRRGRGVSRLVVAIDSGVSAAWPLLSERIRAYASAHTERVPAPEEFIAIDGGESCKNSVTFVDRMVEAVDRHRICRQSFIIAIGGGAVLDAVGFAASIAHRGVRLVRVPTTVLAQDDASLGVKNGVNRFGKKNFVGAFTTPWAVLNDEQFLETLPEQHWRDGFSEAVKIALLRDPGFFHRMEEDADAIRARNIAKAMPVIRRSAELHLRHIVRGGDPFELREARPLDYGHWSAHKLETLTAFALSHGAAVGVGVALDTMYAALEGRLPESDARRTLDLLDRLGIATWHPALGDTDAMLRGLEEFREHLGGRLTLTLLRGIGQAEDVHAIDHAILRGAIERLRPRRSIGRELR
ncbi:MAG: 3-dehydroquinate synthase [Phycisphaerae bacterium]|nr:3-dehydroquinate synthase [Phycisphaerae bacterium]